MAVKKKLKPEPSSTIDDIKEEVIILLTGQYPQGKDQWDYAKLLKRVTVILIAIYGIGKFQVVRQLAFSILTTFIARWAAEKAMGTHEPAAVALSTR